MAKQNDYNSGIMAKNGKEFADEFFADENQSVHESNTVVLVLKKSDEIDAIVEDQILGADNPSISVDNRQGYWWIKAEGEIVIDCEDAADMLGKPYSVYDLLVDVSSTVGRAYTLGEKFTITTELMGMDRELHDV